MAKQYSVPALEKSISILDLLAVQEHELTVTEIHQMLEIPKATAFMILHVMENHNLVTKTVDGHYMLGSKIYSLGMGYMVKMDLTKLAAPFLAALSVQTGFTVHLGRIVDNQVMFIDKVEQPSFIKFNTFVGQRNDIHSCSLGKAIAANMDESQVRTIIEAVGMNRYTPNTITDIDKFFKVLGRIRETGYAIEDEEGELGVRCIGSAIYGQDGQIAGAVSVTALKSDLTTDLFPSIGNMVEKTAQSISKALGHPGQKGT